MSEPPPADQRDLVIGLDLGGTKLLGVVLDAADPHGMPLTEARVPTPRGDTANLLTALGTMVAGLSHAAAELGGQPRAVGLGAPGLVDRDGIFRFGANLPGVEGGALEAGLRESTGLVANVDNDATCAAWGEHERGAARRHRYSVMVTLGTGIGAGIVADDGVLRGAHGFAGEPGHMIVEPGGVPCPCGNRGCWERYASGSGLGRLGRDEAVAGRTPRVVELAGGDPEDVRGEHVTRAAAEGDAAALAVLDRFGWWVAVGLANLVNILDTEAVVIGGGLVDAGDLILEPARAAFNGLVYGARYRPAIPIVAAELGEYAGVIGAGLLAAERDR